MKQTIKLNTNLIKIIMAYKVFKVEIKNSSQACRLVDFSELKIIT